MRFILLIIFSGFISALSAQQHLNRKQLAETVIWAITNKNADTVYKLSPQVSDYKYWYQKAGVYFDSAKAKEGVKMSYENTRHCFSRFNNKQNGNNPDWQKTTIKNIIYTTERSEGNEFSAILVEMISEGKKYYLQIDAALSNRGWIIQDDLFLVIESEEKMKEIIKNKNRQQTKS